MEEKYIEEYIGTPKTLPYYIKAFKKYENNGGKFKWNWSWWALFGGFNYLLYRKLYLETAIYLFINFAIAAPIFEIMDKMPLTDTMLNALFIFSTAIWLATGGILPYFVYKRYKKIKADAQAKFKTEEAILKELKSKGGVNRWVIYANIILGIISLVYLAILIWVLWAVMTHHMH